MSDERRRDLERRAAAGDAEAQTRILAERVRAGVVLEEDLLLLAYLGDPLAGDQVGAHGLSVPEDLSAWGLGLADFGPAAPRLAAIAAAQRALICLFDETLLTRAKDCLVALESIPAHALDLADVGDVEEAWNAYRLALTTSQHLNEALRAAEAGLLGDEAQSLAARAVLGAANACLGTTGLGHHAAGALCDLNAALAGEVDITSRIVDLVRARVREEVLRRTPPE